MKTLFLFLMLLLGVPSQNVIAQSQSQRCEAITQKGVRCKNQAINKTKYCRVHQSAASKQCIAKTKEGKRCSRKAKCAGYCDQHYKMYAKKKK